MWRKPDPLASGPTLTAIISREPQIGTLALCFHWPAIACVPQHDGLRVAASIGYFKPYHGVSPVFDGRYQTLLYPCKLIHAGSIMATHVVSLTCRPNRDVLCYVLHANGSQVGSEARQWRRKASSPAGVNVPW